VVDDGRIPGALGSKPFDGEGLPTRRTVVVEDGILRSYLLDGYAARRLGLASTGNASRPVGGSPAPAPTNFFLEPGAVSAQEIIRSLSRGFYVTELIGFGVNLTSGDYSRGAVGHWIENGELAYPVHEVTIAGRLPEMLQAIEAVGNDLELRRSVAAPTLLIGKMTVAGK
jgi:PmbA protein